MSRRYVWAKHQLDSRQHQVTAYREKTQSTSSSKSFNMSGSGASSFIKIGRNYEFDEDTGKYSMNYYDTYTYPNPKGVSGYLFENGKAYHGSWTASSSFGTYKVKAQKPTLYTSEQYTKNETVYSKGYRIGYVSARSYGAYPNNGQSNNFWYVYQGQDSIDPQTVTIPSQVFGGSEIAAKVTPSANQQYSGSVSYTYQYQINNSGRWTAIGTTASPTHVFTVPYGANTVSVRVKAQDNLGFVSTTWVQSAASTVINNAPPTAPGNIQVTGVLGGSDATITLTAATDTDGTISAYIFERQVDGGGWQQIARVNSLTQTDRVSSTWGSVAYRAKAVDDDGVSGPYVTSQTFTVNSGWILIGGPSPSNVGVQSAPFNLPITIEVSDRTGVTGIALEVFRDTEQIYSGVLSQGDSVNIFVDTRSMASGRHAIQAIATKEDYLPANTAWFFTVPSIALPDGGRSEQMQNADGQPIFPVTTTRDVIGPNGESAQTQIDKINRSRQGITGHLAFVDAVMGPNASYVLARAAATTYAYQYFAPASAEATGAALVSVYPGYNGAVGDLLTAVADTLTFNIPANGLLSIYQYNLDATDPPNTDPTANFVTLDQPHVVTAATNTGNTADGLEDALTAMMRAFPSRNYYTLNDAMDPDATYYVVSQAVIGPDTASATVAYVSSANPTTWYQGVQITLMNTSNIPALFDYISSPLVSAATTDNPVVAGVNLNATLATMIKAQPIYLRYQLESSTGVLYYVCSPTAITPETVSAINVLYCTASGTYYNGETLTLAPPTDPTPEVTE